MNKYLILAIVALLGALCLSFFKIDSLNEKYSKTMANVKAYAMELSTEKNKNVALQLTVDQFGYFKDSVLKELQETQEELKIKNKNLKALQAVHSSFVRTDTIVLSDTIFRDPSFKADTLLGDEWYSLQVGLEYPSLIVVKPEFKSKKHIIVSAKKETVNPPKKFFLFRWLQKKHRVLNIDVVEKNPYVKDEGSKYVEILK